MTEHNDIEKRTFIDKERLKILESTGAFEIVPYGGPLDLDDTSRFKKLELGPAQKMQVGVLVQQIPAIMATDTMAQAYVAKFPQGLPHTLTALGQGGVGSMIQENGRYVGSASFYSLMPQAAVMGAFTAMSIASGQFFLAQINSKMQVMNQKLEDILGFLYGDKKAELMSEMSFVRCAFQNYNSIMSHSEQRVATIAGLQEARKVAMKDIEFYLEDLGKKISIGPKDGKKLSESEKVDQSLKLKESLNFSLQLYVMSNIMEVHFSQNQDSEFLESLRKDMLAYIDKCDRRILSCFNDLKGQLGSTGRGILNEAEKKVKGKSSKEQEMQGLIAKIEEAIEPLNSGEDSEMKTIVNASLADPESSEFYISRNGNIYIKNCS